MSRFLWFTVYYANGHDARAAARNM